MFLHAFLTAEYLSAEVLSFEIHFTTFYWFLNHMTYSL